MKKRFFALLLTVALLLSALSVSALAAGGGGTGIASKGTISFVGWYGPDTTIESYRGPGDVTFTHGANTPFPTISNPPDADRAWAGWTITCSENSKVIREIKVTKAQTVMTDELFDKIFGDELGTPGATWTAEPYSEPMNYGTIKYVIKAVDVNGVEIKENKYTVSVAREIKGIGGAGGDGYGIGEYSYDMGISEDQYSIPIVITVGSVIDVNTLAPANATVTVDKPEFDLHRGETVVVTITIKENGTPTTPKFTDVKSSDYFYAPVQWAVANNVTSGTTATTFSPNKSCTRAEAMTFLWAAANKPEPKTTTNPFTDVKPSDYYYKAVLWAVENGITSGTSATTFGPKQVCSRAQIMTFLYAYEKKPEATGDNPFKDVPAKEYYYKPVLWAVQNQITAGTSATTFGSNDACTRGQIMTFLYKDIAQ